MTECVFCRSDLHFHCKPGSPCTWLTCKDCGATLDPIGRHATVRGECVPWPHTAPDRPDDN